MSISLDLADPPAKYRPVPFWSWNDKLDPGELRRQVREMAAAGFGGFFMHARGGLQTAYLSREWMECVNACLDEAGKCGIGGWLYDENGWPSGFGGGLVNGLGIKYQQKYLRYELLDTAEEKENTIACYDPDTLELVEKNSSKKLLRCYYEINPFYVDNLDPEVVREFIRVTHRHYYETIPRELLVHLRGIFTDEPQLSRKGFPWSFVLENEYRKAYRRELLRELPLLFLRTPESDAMRIRFWKLCTRLFAENFQKQIYDWCEEKGWLLTGHHLLEETCRSQLSCNGAIMPQYKYYHIPGMDHLGRSEPSPLAMTQLVSVAMQFGRKQILSESFACCGWNINFSGLRWLFQQQFAHGVNFVCPHLSGYSLRGLRKRDYPPSLFYHQPWWGDFKSVNDYFARTGMLLAEGKAETDVLIVHPQSSVWSLYTGNESASELEFYSKSLEDLTRSLRRFHVPHHYADEQLVASDGAFENGAIRIGLCSYCQVVIPQMTNLSRPILELLKKLVAAGGKVLAVRNSLEPDKLTIDGEPAPPEVRDWFRALPSYDSEEAAAKAIASTGSHAVILEHGVRVNRVVSTWRDFKGLDGRSGRFFFIANTSCNQSCDLELSLPYHDGKQVEVIDPATGEFIPLAGVRCHSEYLNFHYSLAAGDAAMFFLTKQPPLHTAKTALNPFQLPVQKSLSPEFTLAASSGNLLTLDRCRYRVDGDDWITDDVSVIQGRLLKLGRSCELEIEYEVDISNGFDFSIPLTMLVETPNAFSFTLNGKPFRGVDSGYLFDIAFRKVMLPNELIPGRNIIGLKTRFAQNGEVYSRIDRARCCETEYNMLTFDSEIESIYLWGDFAVKHNGRVEPLMRGAERLHGKFSLDRTRVSYRAKDLVLEGFPFFAGELKLVCEFELNSDELAKIQWLRFRPVGGNTYRIWLNGEDAGTWTHDFAAFPIAGIIHAGKNQLEVEITTSLRNLLGPFHLQEGERYTVGTLSFNREPNVLGWAPPPYDPGYCMVKLGIDSLELA